MGGWGSTGLNVAPDGRVLPCHAADTIPGLSFETVRATPLAEIWSTRRLQRLPRHRLDAGALPTPASTAARDLGGCRCQALALAGDARAADPVCRKSPHRPIVDRLLDEAAAADPPELVYRGR